MFSQGSDHLCIEQGAVQLADIHNINALLIYPFSSDRGAFSLFLHKKPRVKGAPKLLQLADFAVRTANFRVRTAN